VGDGTGEGLGGALGDEEAGGDGASHRALAGRPGDAQPAAATSRHTPARSGPPHFTG
jgi:hypothetical protein